MPHRTVQLLLVTATAAGLVFSLRDPIFPDEQWLQHTPTVIALVGLGVAAFRRWFGIGTMTCLLAFVALHILGARWVYSNVPYLDWVERVLGEDMSASITGDRNHYDRVIHVAFGVLFMLPLSKLVMRWRQTPRWVALVVGILVVLAASAIYEVFEWALTIAMNPARADRYNGQQGDMWDAQKDMALAGIGALLSAAVLALLRQPRSR